MFFFRRRPNAMPKNQLMQPGVTRFNLPYFSSNEEVDYIFDALDFVASNGWKFLPLVTIIFQRFQKTYLFFFFSVYI